MLFYDSVQCYDVSIVYVFIMCWFLVLWLFYMEYKDMIESVLELILVNGKGDFDDLVRSYVVVYIWYLVYGDFCIHEG